MAVLACSAGPGCRVPKRHRGTVSLKEDGSLVLPGGAGLPAWAKGRLAGMLASGRASPVPQLTAALEELPTSAALLSGAAADPDPGRVHTV